MTINSVALQPHSWIREGNSLLTMKSSPFLLESLVDSPARCQRSCQPTYPQCVIKILMSVYCEEYIKNDTELNTTLSVTVKSLRVTLLREFREP